MTEYTRQELAEAYREAYRDGMRAAGDTITGGLKRAEANAYANKLPVMEGDAYLAGYYAELRRLRQQ